MVIKIEFTPLPHRNCFPFFKGLKQTYSATGRSACTGVWSDIVGRGGTQSGGPLFRGHSEGRLSLEL